MDRDFLTERNVALMRDAYHRVGDGFEGVAWELVADDVVVRDRPEIPDPRTYRGREGLLEALASSDESFEDFRMDLEDLIGVGDSHVVVILRMHGRGRGSGVPVEEQIAHLWTVRDGKAAEMQVYTDPEDALRDARAAAGQRAPSE
jgi:ketosteroid isomerase-like protein